MLPRKMSAARIVNAALKCAVAVALVLVVVGALAGCGPGNDSALASSVKAAAQSTAYAAQVKDVAATSDGKVTITLISTGSEQFGDKIMPTIIAHAVLNKVKGVKQLTLAWEGGSQIGVYTAK
jgi:hypothetical protein